MTKTIVCSLGVLALSLLGTASNAQTFFIGPNTNGAAGQWQVTLNNIGGNPTSWHVAITAAAGAVPNSQVWDLSLRFKDAFSDVATGAAANMATAGVTGGAWIEVGAVHKGFETPTFISNNPRNIKTDGSNTFSVDLTGVAHTAQFLQVKATGISGATWLGTGVLAPEAGAMVQFLPALLPVGLVLGRRRFLRKKVA